MVLEHEIEQQSAAVRAWAIADHHHWEKMLAAGLAPRFSRSEVGRHEAGDARGARADGFAPHPRPLGGSGRQKGLQRL
ncbi:hypothetical protein ACU686_16455 [Yinghuangia aomiensis]